MNRTLYWLHFADIMSEKHFVSNAAAFIYHNQHNGFVIPVRFGSQ